MANTKKVRFLYEWDNIEQRTKQLIKGVQRAPFFQIYSSLVELSIEPQNKEEYKFLHQFIGVAGYDTQCTDSSRLTRCPNVFRKDKGKVQELIFL